jgi:hypothetical protein
VTASIRTPEDLLNVALRRIGYRTRVTNFFEGSAQADVALDIYGQTRDELLRKMCWGFAERNVAMTLLKQAPIGGYFPPLAWDPTANPPLPWFFEYAYPSDCLDVRAVKQAPLFVQNFDPQPVVFAIENDNNYAPPQRVVLCNVPNALLVYTGQIFDLSTWEQDALEAFAAVLGRRLAPVLVGLDAAKMAAADEMQSTEMATEEEG